MKKGRAGRGRRAESPTQEILRDVPFILNIVVWLIVVMAIVLLLGMIFHFMPRYSIQHVAMRVRALPAPAVGLAAGLLILIVDAMRPEGVAPFIYYQF